MQQEARHVFRLATEATPCIAPLLSAKENLKNFLESHDLKAKILLVDRSHLDAYPIVYIRPKGPTTKEQIIAALAATKCSADCNIGFQDILCDFENGPYTNNGFALIAGQNTVAQLTKALLSVKCEPS